MLEVMDSAAGITAYRYGHGSIDLNVDFIMATACVDSFTMFDEMVLGEDLVFATYVNYVGRTSMEVEVDVLQGDKIKAFALFTMVARHKSDHNKAYELPFLNLSEEPDLPKAKLRYERGVTNRSKSQEQAKKAFDKSIPEKEEIKLLMSVLGKKKSAQSNDNSIKMRSTVSSKSLLMHSQDRNVQGKIFGGFLMREMIELAWFSCMKASKGK
jgi:acyl-coenzyme A thioesterase 9